MSTRYSPKEVCGIVGVTAATLFHWRARGVGPNWTRYGSLIYYSAGDLRDYISRVGPIPTGLTARQRQTFFTEAHATPDPEPEQVATPEPTVAEPPVAALAEQVAELIGRVATIERVVVKLRANASKRKRVYLKRKVRKVRGAGAPKVPTPTPTPDEVFPY